MWERACSRWDHCGLPARPRRCHRRQASSHRFCGVPRRCDLPGGRCGSGLARDGITAVYQPDRVAGIAGKPAPTGFVVSQDVVTCQGDDVGAGLLAMGSLRFIRQSSVAGIAGKPAPTGFVVSQDVVTCQGDHVGAGLLAMASLRFTSQTASLASQASHSLIRLRVQLRPGNMRSRVLSLIK